MLLRHMFKTSLTLAVFALIGTALLAITDLATKERIAENEYQALLNSLQELVPTTLFDNDIVADRIEVTSREWLGTDDPVSIYRARQADKATAVVLTPIAPDGYNGNINLLVAVKKDGTLLGVRVIRHRETPGLGDGIEIQRSPWITQFDDKSLTAPQTRGWKVKKDGGEFDQLTGATITPRAIVKAVHRSLQYYAEHKQTILTNESVTADEDASK